MTETSTRFAARLTTLGIRDLNDVTLAEARSFVHSPTRYGTPPETTTLHARRTAIRTLYRTARLLAIVTGDPTLDLVIPSRGNRVARPLTDDEVTLCRASAQVMTPRSAPMRTTAWALGECGAVSSEITRIRICDAINSLDYDTDGDHLVTILLPGTTRHDPRRVQANPWASRILRGRIASLHHSGADENTLLAYGGHAPAGGAKAQASVCNALRHVLDAAGLGAEADIRPASLRNWFGHTAFEAGCRVPGSVEALN